MLIKIRKSWEMAENKATPEHIFLNRRTLLTGAGAIGAALAAPEFSHATESAPASLYPAKRNDAFKLDRALTPEKINADYNNFYEFGMSKHIGEAAARLQTRPWSLKIDGLCNAPREIGIDDLVRSMQIEERLYRHRCVEAWSMAIPWTGFPLAKIVALADPRPEARYLRFETFKDPKVAPGQRQTWYPWPYVEGVTLAEAGNDLAFMVTGAYGKELPNQFGAPLRLALPWKYGFKSIKSIVRISFVAERPVGYWEKLQAGEYGFWANVNPAVPHPRWSQASEEVIGTGNRVPTLLYNGYGQEVAGLYKDMEQGRALFF
ncbi:MAG: protein-methionine-sulfoxide reductase catalytic subunit MsrP [Rhodoblastus sp.]